MNNCDQFFFDSKYALNDLKKKLEDCSQELPDDCPTEDATPLFEGFFGLPNPHMANVLKHFKNLNILLVMRDDIYASSLGSTNSGGQVNEDLVKKISQIFRVLSKENIGRPPFSFIPCAIK